MNVRDLAVLTFRAIALWPIITGLTHALETAITWPFAFQQFANATRPGATPRELATMAAGAFLARVAVGVLLWVSSGALARLAVRGDGGEVLLSDRRTLYLSAMFLAGVWLIASALPTAGYWTFWAVRTGWRPQETEEGAQLAELAIRILVGGTLIRGSWLLPTELRSEPGLSEETAAEQADSADEVRNG